MCSEAKEKGLVRGNLAEIVKYRPAVYSKKSKEKFVYFYVLDPESILEGRPKLRRIRKKFNSYKSARLNDQEAMRFVVEVNRKLAEGWNPLMESNSKKAWTLTKDVLCEYERYMKKLLKDDVITEKTHTDYASRLKMLRAYVSVHAIPYIYMFDRTYIEGFLEYIYVDRDVSPRTRNNYLTWLSSICSWMVECGYMVANVCKGIKDLRNKEKLRKALSDKDRERLFEYLEVKDRNFLLACKFHYYTLIRPKEMALLKVGDVSVSKKQVFVSKKVSKSRKDAVVAVPQVLMKLMVEMGVLNAPSSDYLFSYKFKPGARYRSDRQFRDKWDKVRDELNFPKNYQFYSLKDTGITNIINKVGLNVAKDQARHSSVAVTNAYASKEQMKAHSELFDYE